MGLFCAPAFDSSLTMAREVEVTISSAKDLKNVNWRHGSLKPYAVVWIDPKNKCTTRVDEEGDTSAVWNKTLVIPLPTPDIDESTTLFIDIVHAGSEEDTKPLIGSAKLKLLEVGAGERVSRTLKLKRPSGRPQGKIDVEVYVKEPPRYPALDAYYGHGYPIPPPSGSRDYSAPPPYGNPYAPPPPDSYNPYYSQPPVSSGGAYPYGAYGTPAYSQSNYGGQAVYGQVEEKKGKFGGMGTGLAVGAVAGVLGGLAIAEGVDYVEDKIADDAAEKVADDLGYDDDF